MRRDLLYSRADHSARSHCSIPSGVDLIAQRKRFSVPISQRACTWCIVPAPAAAGRHPKWARSHRPSSSLHAAALSASSLFSLRACKQASGEAAERADVTLRPDLT